MDVLFLRRSVFDIPSTHRVGAIVHDGARDMRLWPGPGSDRRLKSVYGAKLSAQLDREREQLGVELLGPGEVARVHPGELHCDFLAWIGTRDPEPGIKQSRAPNAVELREAVLNVLSFAAERSVSKLAFPDLGDGPSALEPDERLAVIVKACHEYEDKCFEAGRASVVETVLVCHEKASVINGVRRRVSSLAQAASASNEDVRLPVYKATKKRAAPRTKKPALDPERLGRARERAPGYDRTHFYVLHDWLRHKKFGVGQVQSVTPEGAIVVQFEDGFQKKLIHGR